ncbi:MAG: hypothetical protein CL670_07080 [Balneola sp.]|jgi:hypothetical protein|nr:hypothetical protein [Balneola sp.]MBE78898.1 hypothetical protein [Balneola sp.]|tara:strand:+ start:136 stop:807 length:672 start_codon:yes stop_codon:yes gene_type:complete
MLKNLIALLVLLLFSISCSTNNTQYLVSDYNNKSLEGRISVLTIELNYLYDEFPDYIFGALRPDERKIFDQSLERLLAKNTNASIAGTLDKSLVQQLPMEQRVFELNKSTQLEMVAPSKGALVQGEDLETRFVVIFDQFNFEFTQIESGGGGYAGHETKVETKLNFETKYIIWDNEIKDAIAWGSVDSDDIFDAQNPGPIYSSLIDKAINKIIRKSPFPSRNT